MEILQDYDFINIVGINRNLEYVGVVSCTISGISSDSAAQLFARLGVEVRTGLHCAPIAHEFLGTYPAGTIRFSVGVYNNNIDFQHLKDVMDYIEENI